MYEDELPEQIVPVDSKLLEPIEIDPPCDFTNFAYMSGRSGMNDNVRVDVDDHFDETDINLRFYSTTCYIVITHKSRYGLKSLKNQIINFSEKKNHPIEMKTLDYGFSSYPTVYEKSGKMYIEVLDNEDIKFTWCDVIMSDNNDNNTVITRGSCTVTP